MVDALLVVFGAGASFDSVADTTSAIRGYEPFDPANKPPLGNHLFENRPKFGEYISRFSAMGPIVQRLRRSTRDKSTSLERELERLQSEADVDPRRHEQLMAVRFYLRHVIRECSDNWFTSAHRVTNYASLVEEIEHWRRTGAGRVVTYVTFNYDTLLERSAQASLKNTYETLDSYVNAETAWIIKPHGSVDWARVVKASMSGPPTEQQRIIGFALNQLGPLSEEQLIGFAAGLSHTSSYHKTDHVFIEGVGHLVPAIAIPFETKKSYECPEEHLAKMKTRILMTTKMLVIGWRGAEAHFLKILRDGLGDRKPATLVVAGSRDEAIETLGRLVVPGTCDAFPGSGFSAFMVSGRLGEFLNSRSGPPPG